MFDHDLYHTDEINDHRSLHAETIDGRTISS
jgi:hypothetical protein